VWVGSLNPLTNDAIVRDGMKEFGSIEEAFIIRRNDRTSKGYGFVTYAEANGAGAALAKKFITIQGRVVTIDKPRANTNGQHYSAISRALLSRSTQSILDFSTAKTSKSLSGQVDSGCTPRHLTPSTHGLQSPTPAPKFHMNIANGTSMVSAGVAGNFEGQDQTGRIIEIKDLQVLPGLSTPLFPTYAFMKEGKDIWFSAKDMSVNKGTMPSVQPSNIYAKGFERDGLFHLDLTSLADHNTLLANGFPYKKTWGLWHERLMHAGYTTMKRTMGKVRGFEIDGRIPASDLCVCAACILGKMHRRPHQTSGKPAEMSGQARLAEITLDILYLPVESYGGHCYVLGLSITYCNGLKICYLCSTKLEVIDYLPFIKKYLENLTTESIA
jgi:hypothetical protein